LREYLTDWDPQNGPNLAAVINALQIQLLNYVYGSVADRLTEYENHKTDSKHENALIAKTFLFKFINSYNSLFYIAFIKHFHVGCAEGGCMYELQNQLGIIFISQIVVNNTLEVRVCVCVCMRVCLVVWFTCVCCARVF
jgi:anoctamin-10/anoctamin-7